MDQPKKEPRGNPPGADRPMDEPHPLPPTQNGVNDSVWVKPIWIAGQGVNDISIRWEIYP